MSNEPYAIFGANRFFHCSLLIAHCSMWRPRLRWWTNLDLVLAIGLASSTAWPVLAQSEESVARRAFGGIQPVLSPDGRVLALSFQGAICRMAGAGGTLTRLTRGEGWDVEPAWSPDGKRIGFINTSVFTVGTLQLIAADDGS